MSLSKAETMRWVDQDDFTPEHDEIMADLLLNWREYVWKVLPQSVREKFGAPENIEGKLVGELPLGSSPTVFPDAAVMYQGHILTIFEIKPRIYSFGSILRQLRIYQRRAPDEKTPVVLITHDPRWDSFFQDQGFPVVHPDVEARP